jgi:hypothetical protein
MAVSGSLPLLSEITAEDLARLDEYRERLQNVTNLIKDQGLLAARDQLRDITSNSREFREDFLRSVDATKKYFSELSSEMDSAAQKIQIRLREINDEAKKQRDGLDKVISEGQFNITDIFALTPDQMTTLQTNLAAIRNATGGTADEIKRNTDGARQALEDLVTNPRLTLNQETLIKGLKDKIGDVLKNATNYTEASARLTDREKVLLGRVTSLTELQRNFQNLTNEQIIRDGTALGEYTRNFTTNILDNQKKQLEAGLAKLQQDKISNELARQMNALQREELEGSAPLVKMEQMHAKSLKDVGESMSGVVDSMTLASSSTNAFGSALTAMLTHPEGGISGIRNLGLAITEGLGASFLKPELAANRLFNFLNEKLIKATFDFNKISAEVNKQTGGLGGGFESIAFNRSGDFSTFKQSDLAAYGLGLKQFSDVYVTLSKNVGNFNNLLDAQREMITRNAAAMTTLGVSVESYTKLTNTFLGSLGKTAESIRDVMNDVARDALGLGQNVGEYTAKLEQSMRNLVGYGREATEIFRQLSGMAQATNNVVSQSDLIAVSDKFKTFNQAASAVSNLNAMLKGTSVNILDMQRADPSERIMMIKRAAAEAGLEFKNLNYGYKSLLAETFFGGDIGKAEAFFDTPLAKMNQELNKSKASEKELQEQRQKSADAQQKLAVALDNMRIGFMPVINFVDRIAKGLTEANKTLNGFGGFILGFSVLLAPVIASFTILRSTITRPFLDLRIQLEGIVEQLIRIQLQMKGISGAKFNAGIATGMAGYRDRMTAATRGPALTGGGIGAVGALIAGVGLLSYLGSQNEEKKMDDGVLVFNQGKVDGYRINDNDVAKMMVGTPTGPLNQTTNFINDNNMSSVAANSTNVNNSFLESYFTSESPLVMSLDRLSETFTSVFNVSDSKTSQLMSTNNRLTEVVQSSNQTLQSTAMQQTLVSTSVAGNQSVRNETVNVVGGGGGGAATMAFGEGTPVKMDVTLNANFTKLVDVISDEVFAKMRRKV